MDGGIGGGLVTVIVAIIGLAVIAALVSNRSNTPQLVRESTGGVARLIGAALSPITGGGAGQGLGYN